MAECHLNTFDFACPVRSMTPGHVVSEYAPQLDLEPYCSEFTVGKHKLQLHAHAYAHTHAHTQAHLRTYLLTYSLTHLLTSCLLVCLLLDCLHACMHSEYIT